MLMGGEASPGDSETVYSPLLELLGRSKSSREGMLMNQFTGESLPLTDLRHPLLCNVYDYWCLRKGDRELPSRKDISPEDMKDYLARAMLIDVSYQPLDFVYRVFGSGIARAHGKDYTGKSVSQLEPLEFSRLV